MDHSVIASDRRRFARNPVRAHALVHCHQYFQSATVVDFSQGGLQLEGTFALFRGDAVKIEFLSGTCVAGTVAWSLGGRTVIAFSEPLLETHPAIAELARSATRSPARHPMPIINAGRSYAAIGLRP
jgi:PilZ domain